MPSLFSRPVSTKSNIGRSGLTVSTTVVIELKPVTYTAKTDDNTVSYTLKNGFQKEKFTINSTTGELRYKDKQTQEGDHKVTIIATNIAGNETEQLITISVEETLSTSIAWSDIGDDNKINANDMTVTTLSGTVAAIDTVTSINISSIVFKQGVSDASVSFSTLAVVELVNTDFSLSMMISEASLTLVIPKGLSAASSFSI
jgi:hypothetical protein